MTTPRGRGDAPIEAPATDLTDLFAFVVRHLWRHPQSDKTCAACRFISGKEKRR